MGGRLTHPHNTNREGTSLSDATLQNQLLHVGQKPAWKDQNYTLDPVCLYFGAYLEPQEKKVL